MIAAEDSTLPLPRWLVRAQDVGLIGPASLRFHVKHAQGFAEHHQVTEVLGAAESNCIDLGSGGGLPGMVLATSFPSSRWTLLDARKRSQEHLEMALVEEGIEDRVTMVLGRAEEWARKPELRERFDLATARGFAKPAITAEIAAGFLRPGGCLVVSEPPEHVDRWAEDGLEALSLAPADSWHNDAGHYRSFSKIAPVDERYPRRVGIPEKRPLF